jgi:hypothetical protein
MCVLFPVSLPAFAFVKWNQKRALLALSRRQQTRHHTGGHQQTPIPPPHLHHEISPARRVRQPRLLARERSQLCHPSWHHPCRRAPLGLGWLVGWLALSWYETALEKTDGG